LARKVLLADDSVTAQNMGRRILVDAGYEVITVNNGSSALKKVNESKPDLIVLDVYMPGYGGLEVCQRIRDSQETARIPILLTVGKLEPFKAEEARRAGADAFIVKPFEASELLTALTKLEDKIVPQRKSGRSVNASDDAAYAKEFGDLENGWKNRLKIPPPHHSRAHETAPAADSGVRPESSAFERATSEAQSQAASNAQPDLKPDEPVRIVQPKEDQPQPQQEAAEFSVRGEASENEGAFTPASEINDEGAFPQSEPQIESEPTKAATATPEVSPKDAPREQPKVHQDEVAAALASLMPSSEQGGEAAASEPEPLPVTLAVAGEGFSGPRWVAQEVALGEDESSLVLEQEMHKAFAVFVAADAARMSLLSLPEEPGSRSSVTPPGEVASGPGESSESHFEAPASFSDAGEKEEIPEAPSAASESVLIEPTQPRVAAEETKEVAAYAAAASAGTGEGTSENKVEPVAASQPFTNAPESCTAGESRYDSELAAAWASWKQVRDSVASPEFTSQIADTAATGFKEIRHEEPVTNTEPENATALPEETGAIASIVDSVLAELKPKLMEEISKKIKKQK